MSREAETLADLANARAPRLLTEVPGPEALLRIDRDSKVTSPSLPRAYPLVPQRGAGSVVPAMPMPSASAPKRASVTGSSSRLGR